MNNTVKGSLILDKNQPDGSLLLPGCQLILEYKCEGAKPNEEREGPKSSKYKLENIDNLLERFSVEDLLRLTYQTKFEELRDRLPEDAEKKATIVRRIIEFARTNELFRSLLNWAKEKNPRVYERCGPYQQGVPSLQKGPADICDP